MLKRCQSPHHQVNMTILPRKVSTIVVVYSILHSGVCWNTAGSSREGPVFTYPSPAETMIQNTVVLKDWSFVALDPKIKPKHLGFRATGTLVNNHPRVAAESKGRFWESTEIRGVHSNCVVQSANKNLFYRLEGPAAPKRHHSLSGLADIMQPWVRFWFRV